MAASSSSSSLYSRLPSELTWFFRECSLAPPKLPLLSPISAGAYKPWIDIWAARGMVQAQRGIYGRDIQLISQQPHLQYYNFHLEISLLAWLTKSRVIECLPEPFFIENPVAIYLGGFIKIEQVVQIPHERIIALTKSFKVIVPSLSRESPLEEGFITACKAIVEAEDVQSKYQALHPFHQPLETIYQPLETIHDLLRKEQVTLAWHALAEVSETVKISFEEYKKCVMLFLQFTLSTEKFYKFALIALALLSSSDLKAQLYKHSGKLMNRISEKINNYPINKTREIVYGKLKMKEYDTLFKLIIHLPNLKREYALHEFAEILFKMGDFEKAQKVIVQTSSSVARGKMIIACSQKMSNETLTELTDNYAMFISTWCDVVFILDSPEFKAARKEKMALIVLSKFWKICCGLCKIPHVETALEMEAKEASEIGESLHRFRELVLELKIIFKPLAQYFNLLVTIEKAKAIGNLTIIEKYFHAST